MAHAPPAHPLGVTFALTLVVALAAALTTPTPALAQTPATQPLDHDVYEIWMDIQDETISPDGRRVAYTLEPEDEGDGTLHVRNVDSGEEHTVPRGLDPEFDDGSGFVVFRIEPMRDSVRLAYTASNEEGDADGAWVVEVETGEAARVLDGEGVYRRLAWDEEGEQLAFVTNRDDWEAEASAWALYRWEAGEAEARVVAVAGSDGVPDGWAPSEHGDVEFSESGERLYFGTAPEPEPEPEDTIPEDEEVVLDVWHWQDDYLQPMQLERREQELDRTWLAVAHMDDGGRIVQLATETVPDVDVGRDGDADLAVGESELPYRRLMSWDWPQYQDVYLVDVETGERRLVLERTNASPEVSPDERHIAWYDNRERDWFAMDVESGDVVNLTVGLAVPFWNEQHDRPYPASPYGDAGWTEDGDALLVYDQYDIWALDPSGGEAPRRVTEGVGRRDGIEFRVVRLDPDVDYIDPDEPMLLRAFDDETKASGFYRDRVSGDDSPREIVMMDRAFGFPDKAEDADRLLYTRESFREFPDLWVAGLEFDDARKVSDANPQQADYRWGTAELVSWRSADGTPLDGILYKPDGFDPDERDRYLENSPLFMADRVETPLLMLHNDEDTAVPWEQGIEMFVAMRRLGKPAWMLNYNGEPHGLPDYPDRRDWAIRMQQFFDHYLKDAPPPVWLAEGVPATEKGRTLGLELVETETETTTAADAGAGGDDEDGERRRR